MFLKRFTFFAFFATVFTPASAQKIDATFDLVRFKATGDKNLVELYCSIEGNSVVYKKVPDGFQASVALEVQVSDSVGIRHFDKLMLKSPVVSDTSKFKAPFNIQKRIFLNNGNYKFVNKIQDVNRKFPASSIEIPLQVSSTSSKIQFSDVQLLESYAKTSETNDYTKSGYRLVSYVSNFYPKGLDQLKYYTEIYNAEKILGKDKPMVVFYRILPARDNMARPNIGGQKVLKAAPVNVFMQELDITTLPSGNYQLYLEIRDEENKTLAIQHRFFQRSNPMAPAESLARANDADLPAAFSTDLDPEKLDIYLLSLRPLATANESAFLETAAKTGTTKQKQDYLYAFWEKRSETNPTQAWLEYKKRIDYVENTFANATFRGYEVDQGRVYLQYGPPSLIHTERTDVKRPVNNSDTKPYQIWHYYQLPSQRNREFVFLQENRANSYQLVHSNANGETANPAWRQQAGYRFNDNERFDRNDPANEE